MGSWSASGHVHRAPDLLPGPLQQGHRSIYISVVFRDVAKEVRDMVNTAHDCENKAVDAENWLKSMPNRLSPTQWLDYELAVHIGQAEKVLAGVNDVPKAA